MKLKYQTLSKEEKNKVKKEFLKKEESIVYKKADRLMIVAIIGVIFAIICTVFDIVYKNGIPSYIMDGFLLIFTLVFVFVMNNMKLKQINKYVINKDKKKK